MDFSKIYYQKILDLVIEMYRSEFEKNTPGHCMKITGLRRAQLELLWEKLTASFQNMDVFIVSDKDNDTHQAAISATKLIELRNKEPRPLLVLIPANSHTSAEDSYGNATFKECSMEPVEQELLKRLKEKVPAPAQKYVETITKHPFDHTIDQIDWIKFHLHLQETEFAKEDIGNNLHHLHLIPDAKLFNDKAKVRARLNMNMQCSEQICDFNKPLFKRINDLPIDKNTIQPKVKEFYDKYPEVRERNEIVALFADEEEELNLSNWPVTEINPEEFQLEVEKLVCKDFQESQGEKVLKFNEGKPKVITVKFNTNPKPIELEEVTHFRIMLMEVDGAAGTEFRELRRLKKTKTQQKARSVKVTLSPDAIEEGNYFVRVIAENERQSKLNTNDPFKSEKIQVQWIEECAVIDELGLSEEEKSQKKEELLENRFQAKRTSDSEDFTWKLAGGEGEEELTLKKDKVQNRLQAYFAYRIGQLKKREAVTIPELDDKAGIWLDDSNKKANSTFYLKYANTTSHNYQINIPSKLRRIERMFIEKAEQFGQVEVDMYQDSAAIGFDRIEFIPEPLHEKLFPASLLQKRVALMQAIANSALDEKGVMETFNFYNHAELVRDYLTELEQVSTQLKVNLSQSEREGTQEAVEIACALQAIDQVLVSMHLPDQTVVRSILLSPLHPLRLTWQLQLFDLFTKWETKTTECSVHVEEWKELDRYFMGAIYPENNPLSLVARDQETDFQYAGELYNNWAMFAGNYTNADGNTFSSVNRQLLMYLRNLMNVSVGTSIDTDVSKGLIVRHLKNFAIQHPYVDKLAINLFNAGDAMVFASAMVEMEKTAQFRHLTYEIRIIRDQDNIINHGEGLKQLINPEFNISEEAEAFSQKSKNRLFPKLRFSVVSISDFIQSPEKFAAHMSFLVNLFPVQTKLEKIDRVHTNFFMNGLVVDPSVLISKGKEEMVWNKVVCANEITNPVCDFTSTGINLFATLQSCSAAVINKKMTDAHVVSQLTLSNMDRVQVNLIHEHSDWVITFDRNLGAEAFDQPSKSGEIPFLLDYIPGEELTGVSSFLTTRPNSEVVGLLAPHFEEFDLPMMFDKEENKSNHILEDLRAVSSSLVMHLNSGKNKAFEVIGSAFTKRILEKKRLLQDSFILPIDLHQNLFNIKGFESKKRADNLKVSIDLEKRVIKFDIIEIKCRQNIRESELADLKQIVQNQINNTKEALSHHFDPEKAIMNDRLDRAMKNKELRSLLSFYIKRAARYNYISEQVEGQYLYFLDTLEQGFSLEFKGFGFIFNFSSESKQYKEIEGDTVFYTFGTKAIHEVLDPKSVFNTTRIEDVVVDKEMFGELTSTNSEEALSRSYRVEASTSKGRSNSNSAEEQSFPSYGQLTEEKPPRKKRKRIVKKIGASSEEPGTSQNSSVENETPFSSESGEKEVPKTEEDQETPTAPELTPEKEKEKEPAFIPENIQTPDFDFLIGKNSVSDQFGILGKNRQKKIVAIDLSETNTISLFGVQGGGKSYSIGTVTEMVLKQFDHVNALNSPLAGVIFHYSESLDYAPEFTSMTQANDEERELKLLKENYGAEPDSIDDIVLLCPDRKVEERQAEYPSIQVAPIAFNPNELSIKDWQFLMNAVGNSSDYLNEINFILEELSDSDELNVTNLEEQIKESELLSKRDKSLAARRIRFAKKFVKDDANLKQHLSPGKLVIIDMRDEFTNKDMALGIFVTSLNIFSSTKANEEKFNKFIVFDEAHKYMDNKELTGNIVTAIREMRHKGVSIMIASQDPPSLPNEIIELSSIVITHKFNSPQWLKHIQKSITQLSSLKPDDLSALQPGEAFVWATKATNKAITTQPQKVTTRPRVTKHGGATIKATS